MDRPKTHYHDLQQNTNGEVPYDHQDTLSESVIPEQHVPATETFTIPETSQDKKKTTSTLKKVGWAIGGLATGTAATVAVLLGTREGAADRNETAPVFPDQTVSAEQVPGGPAATESAPSTADTYGSSPEQSVTEQVTIGNKSYSLEQARDSVFNIKIGDAPQIENAARDYASILARGMNVNVNRTFVKEHGAENVANMNRDIFTGDDSILSKLGKKHDKINPTEGVDYLEPATVIWRENNKNIKNKTVSEGVVMDDTVKEKWQITGNDQEGYVVLAKVYFTVKDQESGAPAPTHGVYNMRMVAKKNLETGSWDFTGTSFSPVGQPVG